MPPLVIPNTLAVTMQLQGVGNTANGFLTFHTKHPVQVGPTTPLTLAQGLQVANAFGAFWDSLKVRISTGISNTVITVTDISQAGFPAYVFNGHGAGTNNNQPLPFQVALLTILRTAVRSRSATGRSYLFGLTESANDQGAPNAVDVAYVDDQYDALIASLNAIVPLPMPLAVASRLELTSRVVVSAATRSAWRTQRRRQL